jgi:hypothetical protein
VIWLLLLSLAIQLIMVSAVYLLGFRMGGSSWRAEAERVHTEGHIARRAMHDLTVEALRAMAVEAERHRQS